MKIFLAGVSVDRLNEQELRKRLSSFLDGKTFHHIVTVNPEFVVEARHNTRFREVINTASLALADGFGLVLASALQKGWSGRLYRKTGMEASLLLASLCQEKGKRLYLLGAEYGRAKKATEVLKQKFPKLEIVGAEEGINSSQFTVHSSQFQPDTVSVRSGSGSAGHSSQFSEEVCERITLSKADVLLVAFGAPKQELWIAENKDALSSLKIAMGVGGAFDYLSGEVPYAPKAVRALGLEWLYRLCVQPHRAMRIVKATIIFPLLFLFSLIKKS